MIRVFRLLVVHIANGINVNQGGDQGHHAEHAHRKRVDVVADVQTQSAEFSQQVVLARDMSGTTAVAGDVISIGAWLADTEAGPDAGRAYAYRLPPE